MTQPIVRYLDDHVVVVEKPAGLTTMRHADEIAEQGPRAKEFLPPTLLDVLPTQFPMLKSGRRSGLRAVHRLDKDTTGLVVLARNVQAERHLAKQFRAHSVEREYFAVVRGHAESGRIESRLVHDRGDGRRGSATKKGGGKRAVTYVEVVEVLGAFSLVRCRLETGRTHQVRIHLGEAGTPLCGERTYDRPLNGRPIEDASGAQRIMLHAATLGFEHPANAERMQWTSPLPDDLQRLLRQLRHTTARDP